MAQGMYLCQSIFLPLPNHPPQGVGKAVVSCAWGHGGPGVVLSPRGPGPHRPQGGRSSLGSAQVNPGFCTAETPQGLGSQFAQSLSRVQLFVTHPTDCNPPGQRDEEVVLAVSLEEEIYMGKPQPPALSTDLAPWGMPRLSFGLSPGP